VPANDPPSASYAAGGEPDRDIIETTEYDALGRVTRTLRVLGQKPHRADVKCILGPIYC
jgi:hypothetical protein